MAGLSSGVTICMMCLLSWKLAVVTTQSIESGDFTRDDYNNLSWVSMHGLENLPRGVDRLFD